jgi:large subunit ribosomal protein L16
MKGTAQRGNRVSFGEYGIKALDRAWITSRQIEAARKAITQATKRGGKVWVRIFPDKPVTSKGQGMPMGKGKGAVDHYVAVVTPGKLLFYLSVVAEEMAREAFRLAGHKLPIKTTFVKG